MSFFADMIEYMSQTDIIHLFFPWLLTLAFTYGVLDKYEVFDDPSVSGAVSLSFSFLAIGGIYFFAPAGIFVNFGATLAFASFVALGFMIVMAIAGIDLDDMTDTEKSIPLIGGLSILGLGLLVVVGSALGLPDAIASLEINANLVEDFLMPMMLLGFILAVVYITARE